MKKLIIIGVLILQASSAFGMNTCDGGKYWKVAISHKTNGYKEANKANAKVKEFNKCLKTTKGAEDRQKCWGLRTDSLVHFEDSKRYFEHAAKKWKRIRNDCTDNKNYETAYKEYKSSKSNKNIVYDTIIKSKADTKEHLRKCYKDIIKKIDMTDRKSVV